MEEIMFLLKNLPGWFFELLLFCFGLLLPIVMKQAFKGYKNLLLYVQTYSLKKGHSIFEAPFIKVQSLFDKILLKFKNNKGENAKSVSPNRQHKGLVGVIAITIKKVSSVVMSNRGSGLNEIYFADKNGDYYMRNTHLDESEILKQIEIINKHYQYIESVIKETHNKISPIFIYEEKCKDEIQEKLITQKFLEIYSLFNIKEYIKKVNDEMAENNAIHFVGDKIGISDFQIVDGDLQLAAYKTDHFTWQVFKEIFKANKSFFQEIILRVNSATQAEQRILVQCLAFLFSSFGIDIMVESLNCKGQKNLIISSRSGRIEKNKEASLHVSVNETFSRTDNVGESDTHYNLYTCVKRGIQEEIGIPEDEIKDEMIVFQDFAIVTDEGEIGLSCYVNLSKLMPIEQILMYPGQDKFLENEEFLVLPYFTVNHLELIKSTGSKKFMHQFYLKTMNDRFNMPWMSFTPLLISRVMIRNFEYNWKIQTILYVVFWGSVWGINVLFFSSPPFEEILEKIWGIIGNAISLVYLNYNRGFDYKSIQPFVSQWYGNAKAIQLVGSKDRTDNSGIEFNINEELSIEDEILLSELEMTQDPKCEVRIKRNEYSYSEKPVSFFYLRKRGKEKRTAQLHFKEVNIESNQIDTTVGISFEYEYDEFIDNYKIKKISFIKEIPVLLNTVRCKENSKIKLEMTSDFSDRFFIQDLFFYKDDYHWSCVSRSGIHIEDKADLKFILSNDSRNLKQISKKNIYEEVESYIEEKTKGEKEERDEQQKETLNNNVETDSKKPMSGQVYVLIKGQNVYIQRWLVDFVSIFNNKRRISELDKYMLQLYLIRHKILFAECEYKSDKNPYKIYYK